MFVAVIDLTVEAAETFGHVDGAVGLNRFYRARAAAQAARTAAFGPPRQVREQTQPAKNSQRTAQRVGGVTGNIAAFGGRVSDEGRAAFAQRVLRQEERRLEEEQQVRRLVSSSEFRGQQETPLNEATGEFTIALTQATQALGEFFGSLTQVFGFFK